MLLLTGLKDDALVASSKIIPIDYCEEEHSSLVEGNHVLQDKHHICEVILISYCPTFESQR